MSSRPYLEIFHPGATYATTQSCKKCIGFKNYLNDKINFLELIITLYLEKITIINF